MIFNPRLGRAMSTSRMGQVRPEDVDDEDDTSKRASAFAPRLGRAYRINEPLSLEQATPFEVSSRAAFSPRLGRGHGYEQTRASAFAPRLGRSDSLLSSTTSDNAEQSNA